MGGDHSRHEHREQQAATQNVSNVCAANGGGCTSFVNGVSSTGVKETTAQIDSQNKLINSLFPGTAPAPSSESAHHDDHHKHSHHHAAPATAGNVVTVVNNCGPDGSGCSTDKNGVITSGKNTAATLAADAAVEKSMFGNLVILI